MGRRMDKARVVDNLRTKHAALDAVLARVPAAAMLEPHFEGAWSVKDLMAHITFWERRTMGRIQATLHDAPPPAFPEGDLDAVNSQAFLANQARPLPEVLADFQQTFEAFVAQAEALSEEDLSDRKRFPWSKGAPVRRYFDLDGYGHYAEHTKQIQAWLDTQGL
jgi:uncharacterized damage-inducible protein DinB